MYKNLMKAGCIYIRKTESCYLAYDINPQMLQLRQQHISLKVKV